MEELIRQILLSDGNVRALAGSRVDLGGNAQGAAMPRVVLWTVGDAEGYYLDGPDGHSTGRIQADCYGATYGEAKGLARAVRAILDGYSGTGLQGVFLAGTRDTREGGTNEAERPYRTSLDFITHHNPV